MLETSFFQVVSHRATLVYTAELEEQTLSEHCPIVCFLSLSIKVHFVQLPQASIYKEQLIDSTSNMLPSIRELERPVPVIEQANLIGSLCNPATLNPRQYIAILKSRSVIQQFTYHYICETTLFCIQFHAIRINLL